MALVVQSSDPQTLQAIWDRITREIHRDDLQTEIESAVGTAIRYYRSSRFEFNERQATFSTVPYQETYEAPEIPSDIGQIDTMRATINGRLMVLEPWTFQYLQNISTTQNTSGQPWGWAWYAKKIFFYPIPNQDYTILISYQQRKDAPVDADDASTVWTNDAQDLIVNCSKKLLYRDVIQDPDNAQICHAAEMESLGILKNESVQLQEEGALSPGW